MKLCWIQFIYYSVRLILPESPEDVILYQIVLFRIGTACSERYLLGILEFPDAVILKSPERVLGVIALSGRSEIDQKLSQLCIHVGVWDEPVSVSPAAGEREKKKQGFVWRALCTFLPDVDVFDLRFQLFSVHFRNKVSPKK